MQTSATVTATTDARSALLAAVLGTLIHFFFAVVWGVVFAWMWPSFRRRGLEASFVALPFAMIVWILMHVAVMVTSDSHPDYYDPNVIIGGFMSHFFFAVPMALYVKDRLSMRG